MFVNPKFFVVSLHINFFSVFPEADVQAVPPVLQLAGHRPRAQRVPVRSQAGLHRRHLHPQEAKRGPG